MNLPRFINTFLFAHTNAAAMDGGYWHFGRWIGQPECDAQALMAPSVIVTALPPIVADVSFAPRMESPSSITLGRPIS